MATFHISDGWLADHVAGDAKLAGLGSQLGGHLLVRVAGADAQQDADRREDIEAGGVGRRVPGLPDPACTTWVPRFRVSVTAAAQPSAGHGDAPGPGWSPITRAWKPDGSSRRARASQDGRSVGSACTLTVMSGISPAQSQQAPGTSHLAVGEQRRPDLG